MYFREYEMAKLAEDLMKQPETKVKKTISILYFFEE